MELPFVVLPGAAGGGPRIVPGDRPVVNALDLGLVRGDGVFETIGVIRGTAQALPEHLERLERSALLLDLPAPDRAALAAAVAAGVDALPAAARAGEASAKIVYTRGVEGVPADRRVPTAYAAFSAAPPRGGERTAGIAVATLTRGYALDVAQTAPWLLQGAKTLSYAIAGAALREAVRRGADDAVFTSSDGYVLEAPNSSVVLLADGVLVSPRPDRGILHGTAQRAMFDCAAGLGLPTAYRDVSVESLLSAQAVWLANSVRLAAPVHRVDGQARPVDHGLTERFNAFLLS